MGALREHVLARIHELGSAKAAEFFEVSEARIAQWVSGSQGIPFVAAEKVFPFEEKPAGLVESIWEGQNVVLCLPWYSSPEPLTVLSVLSIYDRRSMGMLLNFGDANIVRTRDNLTQAFLQTKAEWSLWVDWDMVLPCGNAAKFRAMTGFRFPDQFAGLHTPNRLLSHGKKFVGAVAFGRSDQGIPNYAEGANDAAERARMRAGPREEVVPTAWVGAGVWLVHRQVFEAVSSSPSWFTHGAGTGEDVAFCRKATAAGFPPFVDKGLVCGHIGRRVFGPGNTAG